MKIKSMLTALALIAALASGALCAGPGVLYFEEPGEPGYFYVELPEPLAVSPDVRAVECRGETQNVYLLTPKVDNSPGQENPYERKRVLAGVYGRFNASGEARVTVLGYPWNEEGRPSTISSLSFTIAPGGAGSEEVKKGWGKQWAARFRVSGYYAPSSFAAWFENFAAPRYGLSPPPDFDRPRMETPDLYSVFSSGAAIHESLQLGGLRGNLSRRQFPEDQRPVEMEKLSGPEVKSHPFAQMLGDRKPKESPLAGLVPEDQYYVLFRSLDKQIEFSDLLRDSGGNLLDMTGAGGREYDVRKKLEERLCLQSTPLSRLFGSSVIGEVALTGEDPFFREGTGLTVIFELKKPEVFKEFIAKKHDDAAAKGAVRGSVRIGEREVLSVLSPDGSVSSYYAQTGNFAIISTSLGGLRRSLDCADSKIPSLGEALDLKYVRTIFEKGAGEEDIFIYLSDAHIRHLVGPRWKIEETRRLRCGANLELLSNAALWRKIEKGSFGTPAELGKEKYTGEEARECPDKGCYSVDADTGAPSCSVHGRLGSLTPIGEIQLKEATAEEARQYRDFVESYSRFWRQYFDPIAVRVRVGDDLRIETLILPLIENSWYDGLVSITGKEGGGFTESFVTENTVVSLRSRLSGSALTDFSRQGGFSELSYVSGWLGDEFSVNVCDGQPFIGLGRGMAGGITRGGGSVFERLAFGYLVAALNLPVYLSAEVTDAAAAQRALPNLFTALLPRGSYRESGMIETHRLDDYDGVAIYSNVIDLGFVSFRLFTTVADNRLIVATRHEIVRQLIDGDTMSTGSKNQNGSIGLSVYRENFRELGETVSRGHAEDVLAACKGNLLLTGLLMEQAGVSPEKTPGTIRAVKGYAPQCPSGGRYLPDGESLGGKCTIHGALSRPRSSGALDENAPVTKLVNSVKKADFSLNFTEEGLRAVIGIERD